MIKVCCAIIVQKNKMLVAQRGAKSSHAFEWEFPGGKLNSGELVEACIKREINEELGVDINIEKAIYPIQYNYPEKKIELIPFICTISSGIIKRTEHINFQWKSLKELHEMNLSKADIKLFQHRGNRAILEEYTRK